MLKGVDQKQACMAIRNRRSNQVLGQHIRIADTWFKRLVGLLSTPKLKQGHGLWIKPGGSIHTIGMRYGIDVVFVDQALKVIKVATHVAPFRMCFAGWGTRSVIELPAGTVDGDELRIGDQLEITPS